MDINQKPEIKFGKNGNKVFSSNYRLEAEINLRNIDKSYVYNDCATDLTSVVH